jgi:hypothetical protein
VVNPYARSKPTKKKIKKNNRAIYSLDLSTTNGIFETIRRAGFGEGDIHGKRCIRTTDCRPCAQNARRGNHCTGQRPPWLGTRRGSRYGSGNRPRGSDQASRSSGSRSSSSSTRSGGSRCGPPAAPAAKRGATPAKRKPGRPKKTAALSAERQDVLNSVERIVKSGSGVSASDVARQAGIPQTRAAAALKELKLAKRIFQGGDRRFARYAGEAKTAEQASVNARKTASGPSAAAAAPAPAAKKVAAPRKRAAKSAAAAAPAAK